MIVLLCARAPLAGCPKKSCSAREKSLQMSNHQRDGKGLDLNQSGTGSHGFWAPLMAGGPRYEIRPSWSVGIGVALAVAIFAATIGLSILALLAIMPGGFATEPAAGDAKFGGYADAVALLVYQLATVVLVWFAAGRTNADRYRMLALRPQPPAAFAPAMVIVFAAAAAMTALIWTVASEAMLADLQPFIEALQQPGWWLLAVAIVIGAPLSEELLFRGFLLPVLAQSPLGFVGGAVLSNVAWTALHIGYSPFGLIEIFVIGLIFSWLVWRTGSLWTSILLHGLYNAVVLVVIFAAFGVSG